MQRSTAVRRVGWGIAALVAAGLLAPAPLEAQEDYTVSVGLFYGLGDSLDADEGGGDDTFQLAASLVTDRRTRLGIRYGELSFSNDTVFNDVTNPDLSFVTIAGEYRFPETYFESGVYLGLGAYKLDGRRISTGEGFDDSAFGAVVGVTGEFSISRRFGFVVEGAGHYADLQPAQIFITGHAGFIFRF